MNYLALNNKLTGCPTSQALLGFKENPEPFLTYHYFNLWEEFFHSKAIAHQEIAKQVAQFEKDYELAETTDRRAFLLYLLAILHNVGTLFESLYLIESIEATLEDFDDLTDEALLCEVNLLCLASKYNDLPILFARASAFQALELVPDLDEDGIPSLINAQSDIEAMVQAILPACEVADCYLVSNIGTFSTDKTSAQTVSRDLSDLIVFEALKKILVVLEGWGIYDEPESVDEASEQSFVSFDIKDILALCMQTAHEVLSPFIPNPTKAHTEPLANLFYTCLFEDIFQD